MVRIKSSVTPWLHLDEWKHVADLVIDRQEEKALGYFRVWRSRVPKLPVGVYITMALIEDIDLENRYSLGIAVSRFFDHISHIGTRHFYDRNMHTSAENLQIPSWIVDLRHRCIHKDMPGIHELRLAYDTCYAWIILNYWCQEKKNALPDLTNHGLYELLDLYLYLRIYKEWGTHNVSDIVTEKDIFSHISRLWNSYIKSGNIKNFNTSQALERVNKLLIQIKIIPRELIKTLLDEDLLVPQPDFLNALVKQDASDSDADMDEVKIPSTLLTAWKQIILALDAKFGVKLLIQEIVLKIQDESVDETKREYFAAWIVELSEAILGRSKKLKLREDHGCTLEDLETWLAVPNSLIVTLLPCFCSLVGVTKEKYLMLKDLVSTGAGDFEDGLNLTDSDYITHTLDDLSNENEEKTVTENTNKRWKHERDSYWSSERLFKMCHGQTWECLWLPETVEWEQPRSKTIDQDTDENEAAHTSNYTLYEEDVGLANWPNMVLAPVKDYEPPWERVTDTDVPPLHINAVADSADTNVSPFKRNEVASSAGDSVPHFYRNAVASSGGGSVPHFYRNAAASSAGDSVTHFNKNAVASSGGDSDPNISRNPSKMPLARRRYQVIASENPITKRSYKRSKFGEPSTSKKAKIAVK